MHVGFDNFISRKAPALVFGILRIIWVCINAEAPFFLARTRRKLFAFIDIYTAPSIALITVLASTCIIRLVCVHCKEWIVTKGLRLRVLYVLA